MNGIPRYLQKLKVAGEYAKSINADFRDQILVEKALDEIYIHIFRRSSRFPFSIHILDQSIMKCNDENIQTCYSVAVQWLLNGCSIAVQLLYVNGISICSPGFQ